MIERNESVLKILIEKLELPDSAYENAKKRYEDLEEWFNREKSLLKKNDIHIFPQGSFMLGTAIRPINKDGEYDLDLTCKIQTGVSKATHTQEFVKNLVGAELELYRKSKGIKKELLSKHRCWRLEYRDNISFHIDIVPAIPAEDDSKSKLFKEIEIMGTEKTLAESAADLSISITDDRDDNFDSITNEWIISNPAGYGLWFSEKMENINQRSIFSKKAQVDEVPMYSRKTPLQRCIQLLKRHRDIMFGDNDSQPISIIITTLAARSYNGENNIPSALENILETMPKMINKSVPRVPNPVNPEEDFADKWEMEEYSHLYLEENFNIWIRQAQIDFNEILTLNNPVLLSNKFEKSFSVILSEEETNNLFPNFLGKINTHQPKKRAIRDPVKPWRKSR